MLLEPTKQTLARYGLGIEDWLAMANNQNHRCFICENEPTKGRLCIDHEHVKGWKLMPPEQRKMYVRGLLCWTCNHFYVGRGISIPRAENVVKYLKGYLIRRPVDVVAVKKKRTKRIPSAESR